MMKTVNTLFLLLFFCALTVHPALAQQVTTPTTPLTPDFTFSLDNQGATMILAGGWTADDLKTANFPQSAAQSQTALERVSSPTSKTWVVVKATNAAASDVCNHTSYLDPSNGVNQYTLAHEQALAMFTRCNIANPKLDPGGINIEAMADAKAFLAFRKAGNPALLPMSMLGEAAAWNGLPFFAAGGGLPRDIYGTGSLMSAWFWELVGEKLGGTFVLLDKVFDSATSIDQALDSVVGQIAGRKASTWHKNIPVIFTLSPDQRAALGYATDGDPTDGKMLLAYLMGQLPSPWQSSTTFSYSVVNPLFMGSSSIFHRSAGNATGFQFLQNGNMQCTVSDSNGSVLFVSDYPDCGIQEAPALPDGKYNATICALAGAACDPNPVLTQNQQFLADSTGWTKNALVVMYNGQTHLQLADGQPYKLTSYAGAVAISGLPNTYAEAALTDGSVTRLFPYVPDVPNNVWSWDAFPAPALLGVVDATTFRHAAFVAQNSWITLYGVGMSIGDPQTPAPSGGRFPTTVASQWDNIQATLESSDGRKFPMEMYYTSSGQINALVPQLPADIGFGSALTVTTSLNGVASNSRPVTLAPFTPGIFTVTDVNGGRDISKGRGTVNVIWANGLGSCTVRDDGLCWTDAVPSVTVAGSPVTVLYSGLVPGCDGLYQVNVQMPDAAGSVNASDIQITMAMPGTTNVATFTVVSQ